MLWNELILKREPYFVVVSTEVLKVSEADVREADDDCDDQDHKREHGRRRGES